MEYFNPERKGISRRNFIKIAGLSVLWASSIGYFNFKAKGVSLVIDPSDGIAGSLPSLWALKELEKSLIDWGVDVFRCELLSQTRKNDLIIVPAGSNSSIALQLLKNSKINIPAEPEALGLIPINSDDKQIFLACGYDERGLVYTLLELADRVQYSSQSIEPLDLRKPIVEQPANKIRSIARLFVSEIEDKPWFYDHEMWQQYLTMIAAQRFNRFNLSMGIGYDFLQNVTDAYFLFPYPFFLSVPGYSVRIPQLPDAERDKNLEMLKFISEQTAARGMQFQLGLWMHGYEWLNSPAPNYTIEGLTHDTHGPYCRDALRQLLQACPSITGVTFRIHGESGVNEGSFNFWKTVFEGAAACGRKVEIDMHAKGMSQEMIDVADQTGLPFTISPKYWAEHLGMPYHQADIRAFEIPKPDQTTTGLMKLSAGSRSFMRYGYGDLLKENRPYGVLHRIWPGTQRLLLWGDPVMSSAHSKAFNFCGSAGVELMEPLSFKGRRGSGIPGDRCAYLDSSLKPKWDWQKYLYSLRVFGRLAYNPDTEPDVWRRYLYKYFGNGAEDIEHAVGNASRILPVVLTVHGVSAANNLYWPEMYTNLSIPDPNNKNPFFDTPNPKTFGNVSPMDPQLFYRINDFAGDLLKGERSGKYTPIEYAQWIEDYADAAAEYLAQAKIKSKGRKRPEFRRMAVDVGIQIGLGRFFGAKFRAGVLYSIFDESGDRAALELSINKYKEARGYWAKLSDSARNVYKPDITIGEDPVIRGHWLDRLPAIDDDIELMVKKLEQTQQSTNAQQQHIMSAIKEVLGRPERPSVACHHNQLEYFRPGESLNIELSLEKGIQSVFLYFRHVNHAERYRTVEMQMTGNTFRAAIPADYTDSQYPLQYYFELKENPGKAWLYPGFAADLTNQPYFVVHIKS
ncbi:MAG TPA: hypothetical protein VMT35_15235 [Ignavibacteriaceae bacterium]|nr:hypothetical protein [Ignavibacteriaceae bacterium]